MIFSDINEPYPNSKCTHTAVIPALASLASWVNESGTNILFICKKKEKVREEQELDASHNNREYQVKRSKVGA